MARLIDGDALIAWIKGSQQMTSKMKSIICYIKTMPTVDAVSEWISCSERLPIGADGVSECETVLLSFKEGFVASGWINGRHAYVLLPFPAYDQITVRQSKDVIAWMPLPQPYEETDHE